MLRKAPTFPDGKAVDRSYDAGRLFKPFKPPTSVVERNQPQRKRKRVSYKGQGKDSDGSDSDQENGRKKKKKKGDKDYEGPRDNNIVIFPVFKPKPLDPSRRFSIPLMRNKNGEIIPTVLTTPALGVRAPIKIPPRPLHDPMQDHAIVLYDPTIDDRETDEERKEREKEEAKEKAAKEAAEKSVGLYNPHKPLRKLLGEGNQEKKKNPKVAVVIDPQLAKVLRPHQVEGVKVCGHMCMHRIS